MTRTVRALLALALLLTLTACSGGGGDTVTIYSGRSASLVGPLLERFAEQTGISVDVRYGESAELALLIDQEGDRSPADVFYSQSPGATGFLAGDGRLAALEASTLDHVDERFRNADGQWVGVSGRQRVLVYNTDLMDEADLPGSVFDVVEEPWAGQVAIAPNNGSFQDFITAVIASEGEDTAVQLLADLAATEAPTYANNSAIVEAVSRGEVAMGLVNHYYAFRFLDEDPDLPIANHLFPGDDVGAMLIPSSVSVVQGSDQTDGARQLVEFLLSEESQRYFAEETFEYPLADEVPAVATIPPLSGLDVPVIDIDELGDGLEHTVELIRDSGLSG